MGAGGRRQEAVLLKTVHDCKDRIMTAAVLRTVQEYCCIQAVALDLIHLGVSARRLLSVILLCTPPSKSWYWICCAAPSISQHTAVAFGHVIHAGDSHKVYQTAEQRVYVKDRIRPIPQKAKLRVQAGSPPLTPVTYNYLVHFHPVSL